MRVWRLARAPYAKLDGEGARLYGGRWNSQGIAMIYTASHLSLAVLELLVHTDPDLLPDDLMAFEIDVPDSVAIKTLTPLPKGWESTSAPRACQDAGDEWVRSLQSAVLAVPSAIVPEEMNYLLNPAHSDMGTIRVIGKREFQFDERLVGR